MSDKALLVNMDAGAALKVLMATNKLTRPVMAKALGRSETYISVLCNKKSISGAVLVQLCSYFNITASEFFKLGEE